MRVLIAYDGSPGAAEAVALAQGIAWPEATNLRVVYVIEPVAAPISGPWDRGASLAPELDAAISAHARDTVREAVERLASAGRSVDGFEVRGRAGSAIVAQALEFQADLVIVGSRGHGTIASLLLGSTSSEIVDHASCPVLVARAATLSRVVFATDDSPSARAAEAILGQWPIFSGLPIDVVSVVELIRPWTTGIAPTMYGQALDAYAMDLRNAREELESIANAAAGRLRSGHDRAARDVRAEVREGDPAGEVITFAEERGADLIVLGSRGRTGFTRLLLGSVARNVLSGSTASVLVVRDGVED